jgi:hypothetical protein
LLGVFLMRIDARESNTGAFFRIIATHFLTRLIWPEWSNNSMRVCHAMPTGAKVMTSSKNERQPFGRVRLSISTKLLGVTLVILIAVVCVNYIVFMGGYRDAMLGSYIDRASSFTAVAEEAKSDASIKFLNGTINVEK